MRCKAESLSWLRLFLFPIYSDLPIRLLSSFDIRNLKMYPEECGYRSEGKRTGEGVETAKPIYIPL